MKHYVTGRTISSKQVRKSKRKGYLIPIEGSELEGEISRGCKYVLIRSLDDINDPLKRPSLNSSYYYKKIRVWSCAYCGLESQYIAVFHYAGYDMMERLCKNCVKLHGPIC